MRAIFADASYFIAQFRPRDQWSKAAEEAIGRIGEAELVTTDEILIEFLSGMSRGGPAIREKAVRAIQDILREGNIRVVPQTRPSFLDGLNRFRRRLDKAYSLQDCIAMNVMESEKITEILTSDRHFEQEGFIILMKQSEKGR